MELRLINTSSQSFLCDRYEVVGCESFIQLSDGIKKLEQQDVGHNFLVTLDDLGQACYTSMHTKLRHDLDSIDEIELEGLPPQCFEDNGEHKGYLSCKEEFNIRRRNIELKLPSVTFEDVCDKSIGLYCDDEGDFKEVNTDPSSLLDRELYILKVPVEHSYETIYAFPNGYFDDDLSPFENIVFARTLYEKFGYKLIGLGASYLAFRKSRALSEEQIQELIDLLDAVYREEFDSELRGLCTGFISNNDHLILSYTE